MVLVKYNGNWADEMDLFGYCIYDSEKDFQQAMLDYVNDRDYKYKNFDNLLKSKNSGEFCFSCGSNQEVDYDSVRDFVDAFTVEEISDEEAKTIRNRLSNSQGVWPLW